MTRRLVPLFALLSIAALTAFAKPAIARPKVWTAIFGGGPFYSGGNAPIAEIRQSGVDVVILWTLHVDSTGLIYNDTRIVDNGVYIGDPGWGGQVASMKKHSSVKRIDICVASAGPNDFAQIKALGTAPGGILDKNFRALRKAITAIDNVVFDDEQLYDEATTVSFARMLQSMGYKIDFCPYENMGFWIDCLKALHGQVSTFYLQCYSGGARNVPADWIRASDTAGYDGLAMVYAGLVTSAGPSGM